MMLAGTVPGVVMTTLFLPSVVSLLASSGPFLGPILVHVVVDKDFKGCVWRVQRRRVRGKEVCILIENFNSLVFQITGGEEKGFFYWISIVCLALEP